MARAKRDVSRYHWYAVCARAVHQLTRFLNEGGAVLVVSAEPHPNLPIRMQHVVLKVDGDEDDIVWLLADR
jgi:hypothetical protein